MDRQVFRETLRSEEDSYISMILRSSISLLLAGWFLICGGLWAQVSPGQLLEESFASDPVVNGRFVQQTSDTESRFIYDSSGRRVVLTLDVDNTAAFYRSTPIQTLTHERDVSFSFRFRPLSFDDLVEPVVVVGLMTDTPVANLGDAFALLYSVNDGTLEVRANIENGESNTAGDRPVFLGLHQDYLAVANYRVGAGEFTVEIFSEGGAVTWLGSSTAVLPGNVTLNRIELDRFGAQNAGDKRGDDIDQGRGAITLTLDDISIPAVDPYEIRISDIEITETDRGAVTALVDVNVSPRSGVPIEIGYRTVAGTASPGSDYLDVPSGIARIDVGESRGQIAIQVFGDLLSEPSEFFFLKLLTSNRGRLVDSEGRVEIKDNDGVPVFTCISPNVPEGRLGQRTAVEIVGTLTHVSEALIEIPFSTRDGSAVAGLDYEQQSGVFRFPPLTNRATVTLTVLGDLNEEGAGDPPFENFFIDVHETDGAAIGSRTCEIRVIDDDGELIIFVDESPIEEGSEGVIPIRLFRALDSDISFNLAPVSDTARSPEDFRFPNSLHTIPAGTVESQIRFHLVDDDLPENRERFILITSNIAPAFVKILPRIGIEIIDDDLPAVLGIEAPVDVVEGDPGAMLSLVFPVRLDRPVSFEVRSDFRVEGVTAAENVDFVAVDGEIRFAPGQTLVQIEVPILGDLIDEPDESLRVVLQPDPLHGTFGSSPKNSATGIIRDDDDVPSLSAEIPNAAVFESADSIPVTFRLTLPSEQTTSFVYATADGTATQGSDYTEVRKTLVFFPGETSKTVFVGVINDARDEADSEAFFLRLSQFRALNSSVTGNELVLSILDDDPAPSLRVVGTEIVEGQTGIRTGAATVFVEPVSDKPVSFRWTTRDGTALSSVDYVEGGGQATIPPGKESFVIPVEVTGDRVDEGGNEFFTIDISQANNAMISASSAQVIIREDDKAVLSFANPVVIAIEGSVEGPSITSQLGLSVASSSDVVFEYRAQAGTARVDEDYQTISGTGVIAAGDLSFVLPLLKVKADLVPESEERFSLLVSNVRGAEPNLLAKTIVIRDDDTPTLLVTDVSKLEGDGGGVVEQEVSVTLDRPTGVPVSVRYETRDGSAKAPADYKHSEGVLRFSPRQVVPDQPLIIPIVGDDIEEDDENFVIRFTAIDNVALTISEESINYRIIDDELPVLSISDVRREEGPEGVLNRFVYTARLSRAARSAASFTWRTQDGTARGGGDYEHGTGTLSFLTGETGPKQLTVIVNGDDEIETDEDFSLVLSNLSGLRILSSVQPPKATIVNDDLPQLRIESVTGDLLEGGKGDRTPHVVVVTLESPTASLVSVDYLTRAGTATPGNDYVHSKGRLVFEPGTSVLSQFIEIPILGDDIPEEDEVFSVSFLNPVGAQIIVGREPSGAVVLGEEKIITCRIIDDEIPVLTIDSVRGLEGGPGQRTLFAFRATLSRGPRLDASFAWGTRDGAAVAGEDYEKNSGDIMFLAGETGPKQLTVIVNGDDEIEADEDFSLVLSKLSGLRVSSSVQPPRATIVNDDLPQLRIESVTGDLLEGGKGDRTPHVVVVTLESPTASLVSVDYLTRAGTATPGNDYVHSKGRLVFEPGTSVLSQFIEIPILGDDIPEEDEVFSVSFLNPVGAQIIVGREPSGAVVLGEEKIITCRIIDDEIPVLTIDSVRGLEGGPGQRTLFAFRATLSRGPRLDASFAWDTRDGMAVAGEDYEKNSGDIMFLAGETGPKHLTVIVNGDDEIEADEDFSLVLSKLSGLRISSGVKPPRGTIVNDDLPLLRVESVKGNLLEGDIGGGEPHVLVITLDRPSPFPVSVEYTTRRGTAEPGVDYIPEEGIVVFEPGTTDLSRTIEIPIVGDDLPEDDEFFSIVILNPIGGQLVEKGGAGSEDVVVEEIVLGCSIIDDEIPVLILKNIQKAEGSPGQHTLFTFSASLSRAARVAASFDWMTRDGSTVPNDDYIPGNGTVHFGVGEEGPKQVTVVVRGDSEVEPNETFFITPSNGNNVQILEGARGVGTILNDDSAGVFINDVNQLEGGTGEETLFHFSVELRPASGLSTSVEWQTVAGSASEGQDFQAGSGRLVFLPGVTRQLIVVSARGDFIPEADERFFVELSKPLPDGLIKLDRSRAMGTILDDDTPTLLALGEPVKVLEGALGDRNPLEFRFRLNRAPRPEFPVRFKFRSEDGTANKGSDYYEVSGEKVVLDNLEFSVVVASRGDRFPETNEDLFLQLFDAENVLVSFPAARRRGFIIDDEPCFVSTNFSLVMETCTPSNLAVDPGEDVTVNFSIRNDCEPTTRLRATLLPGPGIEPLGEAQDFGRLLKGDERSRPFQFRTTGDCGGVVEAVLQLDDNGVDVGTLSYFIPLGFNAAGQNVCCLEADVAVSAEPASVNIGFGEEATLVYSVKNLGPAQAKDVMLGITLPTEFFPTLLNSNGVNLDPADVLGDIRIEGDYSSCELQIDQASNILTCDWPLLDPNTTGEVRLIVMSSEPLASRLSTFSLFRVSTKLGDNNPSNDVGTISITVLPVAGVAVFPVDVQEGDPGGASEVSVRLLRVPDTSSTVVAEIEAVNLSATIGEDYFFEPNPQTVTFPALSSDAQEIKIRINPDRIDEGESESFKLRINSAESIAANGTSVPFPVSIREALVTIVDDDEAKVSVRDASVVEPPFGEAVDAVFTVSLEPPSSEEVSVTLQTFDLSASSQSNPPDYSIASGRLVFAPMETEKGFSVPVLADSEEEPDERFAVRAIDVVGAEIADGEAIGTIGDFHLPCIGVGQPNPPVIIEGGVGVGGVVSVPVILAAPMAETVTVNFRTEADSAIAGQDYTEVSGKLTFFPGEVLKTVDVPILGDDVCEPGEEQFRFLLTNVDGATLCDGSVLLKIRDDDRCIDLEVAGVRVIEESCAPGNQAVDPSERVVIGVSLRNVGSTATASTLEVKTPLDQRVGSGDLWSAYGVILPGGVVERRFEIALDGVCGEVVNVPLALREGTQGLSPLGVAITLGERPDGSIACCAAADLAAVIEPPVNVVVQGGSLVTTVKVTNLGPSQATGVFLAAAFAPSEHVQVLSASFGAENCKVVDGEITCPDAVLRAGEERVLTVNAIAIKPASGTIIARVSGTVSDPDNSNNVASASLIVTPPLGISVSAEPSVDEAAGSVDFTLQLSPAGNTRASVEYATEDGEAIAGSDYLARSGTIQFDRSGKAVVSVPIIDDANGELPEDFCLVLSNPQNAMVSSRDRACVTILDNEPPCLICQDVSVNVGLDRSTQQSALMEVRLTKAVPFAVGVDFLTRDGTAIAGADYEEERGRLNFAAGETKQIVAIPIVRNTVEEGDEHFVVQFFNPQGLDVCSAECRVTILDDPPVPLLTIQDVVQLEGSGGVTRFNFGLAFERPLSSESWIEYDLLDGEAIAGLDFLKGDPPLRMVFSPGTLQTNLAVSVIGDVLPESPEKFFLNVSKAFNILVTDPQGEAIILDDDVSNLTISGITVEEGDEGQQLALFEVIASPPSQAAINVSYATRDGTATVADGDYETTSGELRFEPGQNTTELIRVPVNGDLRVESDESFVVVLSNANNAALSNPSAMGVILNDDLALSKLTLSDAEVIEGTSGTSDARFAIALDVATSREISFNVTTADGTAKAPGDYRGIRNEVYTIPVGAMSSEIVIDVNGDAIYELGEEFSLAISEVTGAEVSVGEATGMILDDDQAPRLSVNDVSAKEGDSGISAMVFTIVLEGESEVAGSVAYTMEDRTAVSPADYKSGEGALQFAPGVTTANITVEIVGDTDIESDEAFGLMLSNPKHLRVAREEVSGGILNDDVNTPPIISAIANTSVAVGAQPQVIGFTVSDAETALSDLELVVESLDLDRLPDDLLDLQRGDGGESRLQIGTLDRSTEQAPIGVRVTVIDEHGAVASVEFTHEVTDLSRISIIKPANYSILQIPEGWTTRDVSIEIEVAGEQAVGNVFIEVDSIRLDGDARPDSLRSGVFDYLWEGVSPGEYDIRAKTRDAATGEEILSLPVTIKVVVGGRGEIAIVHPSSDSHDEIFTIWDYLVDLGYQPQVFLQEEISVATLEPFLAVVWHDLGSLDLMEQTVSTLLVLQDTIRMPIYFIGEHLASSEVDLPKESQDEWAEMTQLAPAGGRVPLARVNFNPFRDSFQNQIDGYWALVDGFDLRAELDESQVKEGAQVLAVSGDSEIPVVLRYPATDAEAQVTARRFLQSFPLIENGDEGARIARRVLFENGLCYLLKGEECGCPSAVINLVIETEFDEPIGASLGEAFEIELKLGNNGRCDVRGGLLNIQLPEGLELSDVASERNFAWRWDSEMRTAIIAVGILEDSPDESIVTLHVRSLLPGGYGVDVVASGSYFEPHAVAVSVEIEGAFLAIGQDRSGGIVLQVIGTAGANARVEWSDTLGVGARWQLLENVQFSESETERVVPVGELDQQRFYRVEGR